MSSSVGSMLVIICEVLGSIPSTKVGVGAHWLKENGQGHLVKLLENMGHGLGKGRSPDDHRTQWPL